MSAALNLKRCAAVVLCACAGAAHAAPRVLVFNDADYAASAIPGTPGGVFSSFLDGFTVSQNGSRWALRANASGQPSARDTFYVSGTSAAIGHVFAEGDILPGIGLGITNSTNERTLHINDRGDIAFSGTFGPAPFASDEVVARYNALSNDYTLIAREGDLIPGLGGERYGFINDAAGIRNDGLVYFRDSSTSGSIPSTQDEFIFRSDGVNTQVVLQSGVLRPNGQLGGTNNLLSSLDSLTFYASESGDRYMIRGSLEQPANSSVLVVNDRVAIQHNAPVPGLVGLPYSPVIARDNIGMNARGDWFAWSGTNVTGETYIMVNGDVRFTADSVLPDGEGTYDQFIDVGLNGRGDLVIAARTDAGQYMIIVDPKGSADPFVALISGLFGAGAAVDLDGDGVANDDAFLSVVNDVALGDNGELYFLGRVANSSGLNIGDGLFVTTTSIPTPGAAALLALGLAMGRRGRSKRLSEA